MSATKLNVTSQRPRNIGRKYEVAAKRGLKLRQKQTEAQKRKMRLTSISTTEGIPAMPHHTVDGDNVRCYHVTPESQVEVYVREVIQVDSKVLIPTNKEPRQMCI